MCDSGCLIRRPISVNQGDAGVLENKHKFGGCKIEIGMIGYVDVTDIEISSRRGPVWLRNHRRR